MQQTSSVATGAETRSEWDVIREASEPAWAGEDSPNTTDEGRGEAADLEDSEPGGTGGSGEEATPASPPIGTPDDALVIVDREHGLPRDYSPEDLASLSSRGVPTVGVRDMMLRDEAADAAALLVADARADGVELVVRSAYRSHADQVASYSRWSMVHGEGAGGFSAPPGHSEHQLGTVVDFTNARVDYKLGQRFGDTEASRWLRRHAPEYGFVLSYPPESEEETGYRWEPWHYRYIGRENALAYVEGDFESPQQFFFEEGVRPGE